MLNKLKTPSVWNGIAMLFATLAQFNPNVALYANILAGAAASIAVALPHPATAAAAPTV